MPTVILSDVAHAYAAGDVLRLFFGAVKTDETGLRLTAGPPEPVWSFEVTDATGPTAGPAAAEGNGTPPDLPTADGSAAAAGNGIWPTADGSAVANGDATWPPDGDDVPSKYRVRRMKADLYRRCADETDMDFPWGALTGIRPTLIAGELWRETGGDTGRTLALMRARYHVRASKAQLALDTALAEKRLLDAFPADEAGLYIGIPFCPTRCHYCSFTPPEGIGRTPQVIDGYLDALCTEIRAVFRTTPLRIRTVYIGGGTPASLSAGQLNRLLDCLKDALAACGADPAERCFEAGRPDCITADQLAVVRDYGFQRICINPQTMHDATLARIRRRHTVRQTETAFELARRAGFESVNMDLIAGLAGEDEAMFAETLRRVGSLGPDSVTVHALAVKRASDWNRERTEQGRTLAALKKPDCLIERMMDLAENTCRARGLEPYYLYRQKDGLGGLETVGYARPGAGSLYNVGMMGDCRSVVAFGCGAMSKRHFGGGRVERSPNVKSIPVYIERIAEMAERKHALFGER